MQKQFLVGVIAVFFLLAASGCLQQGKSFADLKAVLEKNKVDGTLAPGTETALKDFESDLLSLKAKTQLQNNRQSNAIVAAIDFRFAIIEMQRALLNAIQEARHIDYYDPSCSKPTSLKKTIDFFDETVSQAELAKAKATSFANDYKEFVEQAGFDYQSIVSTLDSFKQNATAQKEAYKKFCI